MIKRDYAIGDVLLITPIMHSIVDYLDCEVTFATKCPQTIRGNPHVHRLVDLNSENLDENKYDYVFDLNQVYERKPQEHIVLAYYNYCNKIINFPLKYYSPELYTNDSDESFVSKIISENKLSKYVVVHFSKHDWPNRNIPHELFLSLKNLFDSVLDVRYILVGQEGGRVLFPHELNGWVDLTGNLTVGQLKLLIQKSALFIGLDAGPLHIASTTDTPIVSLFTNVHHSFRFPIRKFASFTPIVANIDCYGCHHLYEAPIFTHKCFRGDNACVTKFDPIYIFNVVASYLK